MREATTPARHGYMVCQRKNLWSRVYCCWLEEAGKENLVAVVSLAHTKTRLKLEAFACGSTVISPQHLLTGCQAFPMSSDVYRTPLSRICKLCALQIVLHVSIDTLMYLFRDKCGNRLWMQLRFANFAMFVWLHSYFDVSFEIKKQPRFPIYSCLAGCKWGLINLCDYSFFSLSADKTKHSKRRKETTTFVASVHQLSIVPLPPRINDSKCANIATPITDVCLWRAWQTNFPRHF